MPESLKNKRKDFWSSTYFKSLVKTPFALIRDEESCAQALAKREYFVKENMWDDKNLYEKLKQKINND